MIDSQIVERRVSRQGLGVIVAIEDDCPGTGRKRSIVGPITTDVDAASGGGDHCRSCVNLYVVVVTAAGERSGLNTQEALHGETRKAAYARYIIQRQVVVGGEGRGQRLRRGPVVFNRAARDRVDIGSRCKHTCDLDRVDRVKYASDAGSAAGQIVVSKSGNVL